MATAVRIGSIQVSTVTNNAGFFNGQNMQNNWDSHAPTIGSRGGVFGNRNLAITGQSLFTNQNVAGQPLLDQDLKANGSPTIVSL